MAARAGRADIACGPARRRSIRAVAGLVTLILLPAAALAEPRAVVEGVTDPGLRERITLAVGVVGEPAASAFEARRRAVAAAELATDVLRSEGYYGATVTPDVIDGPTPVAVVQVSTGPAFTLSGTGITFADPAPGADVQAAARAALGLRTGAPGRADDVLAAEARAVRALQDAGFADAAAGPRRVIVDHATRTVEPGYRLEAWQLVVLGPVTQQGSARLRPGWIATVVPWEAGSSYSRERLADFERMLLETGAFDAVTVSLSGAAGSAGPRPVVVTLADRPRLTVESELSWASSEGFGLDGQLVRTNLLGRADTWRLTGRLGQIEQRLETELRLPHWQRPRQTLSLGLGAFRDDTDAFRQTGLRVRSDVTRRWGLTSFITLGAAADAITTREPSFTRPTIGVARDYTAISLIAAGLWDNADDPLDPRSGWKGDIRLEPTLLSGDASLGFVRAVGQASAYRTVGGAHTVLAGRVRVGSLIGGSIPEIPSGRRLYAGGGGSVRGYEFQGIGPRYSDPDRTPVGGLSLVEVSVEVRRDLAAFGGRLGLVGFADAGTLGLEALPALDGLRGGVGIGVRYDLGFAPLRFDVAFPLDDRLGGQSFQLYLGVGQSF